LQAPAGTADKHEQTAVICFLCQPLGALSFQLSCTCRCSMHA
jgi:hypothetical protein